MKTSIVLLAAAIATPAISGAPRTAFDELNRLDPDTLYINPIWRGDTAVVRFETYKRIDEDRNPVGPIVDAGWYLVDVDEKGIIEWWTTTRKDPEGRYAMELGQGADMATTVVGIAGFGLTEMNPLGVPGVGVAKIALTQSLKRSKGKTCYKNIAGVTAVGWGAAAANVAAILGAGPVGLALFVPAALAAKPSKNTRFWSCAPTLGQSALPEITTDTRPDGQFDYTYGLVE